MPVPTFRAASALRTVAVISATVATVGVSAALAGTLDPAWTLLSVPRRVVPIPFYDSVHRHMLMVGRDEFTDGGELVWRSSLDSTKAWVPLITTGNAPTLVDGTVFVPAGGIVDSPRNRMIIWGSNSVYAVTGTWALDLDTYVWSKLAAGNPPSIEGSGIVYDAVGDRVLVLCGFYYSSLGNAYVTNHVWQLTLGGTPAWSLLSPAGPLPTGRGNVTAIYDPPRNRVIMFGGRYLTGPNQFAPLNEAWELSLGGMPTWRFLPPVAPIPQARYSHLAAWDSPADRMVVYGGVGTPNIPADELWSLDLADPDTARWSVDAVSGVAQRSPGVVIFDPVARAFVGGGGVNGQSAGGRFTLTLDGTPAWSTTIPDVTFPSEAGRAVLDPQRDRLVQMYALSPSDPNTGLMFWSAPITRPTPWIGWGPVSGANPNATLITDSVRDRLVLYGGDSDNDVWTMGLGDQSWAPLATSGTPPTPRSEHSAVYDPAGDRMIVYGGRNEVGGYPLYLGDVWALTLGASPTWSRLDLTGPRPPERGNHAAILDAIEHRMVMYGGRDTLGTRQDVWSFSLDTLTWRQWTPAGTAPTPTPSPLATYDGNREQMLVARSRHYPSAAEDVYSLSLGPVPTWTLLAPLGTGPLQNTSASILFDAASDVLLYYRKGRPQSTDQTWPAQI